LVSAEPVVNRDSANLTAQAYTAIKANIITLQLTPGELFTEAKLATQLEMSKTPVREALARLRLEGLVEVSPREGYRAAPITLKDARDLFALRLLLEEEAAALSATNLADQTQLLMLEALCKKSYDPRDMDSISAFLRANTQFHATVARGSGNARLADVLETVLDQMERLFHLGLALTSRSDEVVHEHEDLLKAILAGDPKTAREVAGAQIRSAQKMVLDAMLASPVLQSTNVLATQFK
jgi:DNA-binding GntR family transcriptional regulator